MKEIKKVAIIKFIIILIFIPLMFFLMKRNSNKQQIENLKVRIDSLTQERGHSWMDVQGAPDSIYFVSGGGDTTWYVKAEQLQYYKSRERINALHRKYVLGGNGEKLTNLYKYLHPQTADSIYKFLGKNRED